jgi:hypothetical protein
MCGRDRYGFPRRHRARVRSFAGFHTGDIVWALIPSGKHAGVHQGRVTIRQRPSFRVGHVDVHPRHCRLLHRADGYDYGYARHETL